MSRINARLGLAAAGARARLNSLSGVACQRCPHHYVVSNLVHRRLLWLCGFCGHTWQPTRAELETYNGRVRGRDVLELDGAAA